MIKGDIMSDEKTVNTTDDSSDVPTRRVRMLVANATDIMVLFKEGMKFRRETTILAGVPDGAKLLTVASEPVNHGIIFVVEHESYEPVPINVIPPMIYVKVQTGVPGATKKKASTRKKK